MPTSYERMEQALSEAASHPGQTMNGGTGQSSQSHQQTLPTSHQPVTASTCTALEHAVVSTPQTPSDLPIGSSKAQQDEEVNPDEHAFRGRSSVHRASRTDPSLNTTYTSLHGSNLSPREKSEQKHSPLFSTTQELQVLPRHTYSNMDPLSSSSTHEVSKVRKGNFRPLDH